MDDMNDKPRMSAGHTPEPWSCNNRVGVVFGPDVEVARCGDFGDRELVPFNADRWRADARLIAAAPDLLKALERLMAASERHIFGDECLAERDAASAAIAKAIGE